VDFGTGGKSLRPGRYTKKMEKQVSEESFTPNKKLTVESIYVLKEFVWNDVKGEDYNLINNNCKDFARAFYKEIKEQFC